MQTNHILIIVIAILAVAGALIFARIAGKGASKAGKSGAPASSTASPSPGAAGAPAHGEGVVDSAASAVEDIAGPLLGIDIHPDVPSDELTLIKGLGPKAAATLNAMGIRRFEQIGGLDDTQVAALDARMGAFKGRITRDKWVEQARLLAAGDRAGFEATFGKLGG